MRYAVEYVGHIAQMPSREDRVEQPSLTLVLVSLSREQPRSEEYAEGAKVQVSFVPYLRRSYARSP